MNYNVNSTRAQDVDTAGFSLEDWATQIDVFSGTRLSISIPSGPDAANDGFYIGSEDFAKLYDAYVRSGILAGAAI